MAINSFGASGDLRSSQLRPRSREYYEALKLGEVLVTYGRVMMIGAGGAGKTSLRHGLMNEQLPTLAFSTLLANSLSVKCHWAGAGDCSSQNWVMIDDEAEISELATLLSAALQNKSLLKLPESALAIKDFQPDSDRGNSRNLRRKKEKATKWKIKIWDRLFGKNKHQIQDEVSSDSAVANKPLNFTPVVSSRKDISHMVGTITDSDIEREQHLPCDSSDSHSAIKNEQRFSELNGSPLGISNADLTLTVRTITDKIFEKARLASEDHLQQTEVMLHVWDSGGQVVFMNVLPAFLTKRTLFMLVFDATKDLDKKLQVSTIRAGKIVHIDDYHLSSTELLMQWMASIHAHLSLRSTSSTVGPYPRIMLVGTHLDQLVSKGCNPAEETKRILDSLHLQYKEKTYADLLLPSPGYIVDNTTAGQDEEDPAFKDIRKSIHEFAATNLSVHTPITWVLFRKIIKIMSRPNRPVMEYKEVITIAEACSIPPNALPSVLNFYHELGVLLYYSKIPSLRDVVIATPQWLINHIAKVLIPSGLEDQGRERYWNLLRKNGILIENLYQEVLMHSILNPQALVDLLEHFLLAASIETRDFHAYKCKEYFVPCMLNAPSESTPSDDQSCSNTPIYTAKPIHLIFDTQYVPPGFYVRLLASLAKHSLCRILFQQINRYTVEFAYKDVAVIKVREHTDSIEVQVTRVAQEGPKVPPFPQICRDILELLNASVKEVDIWFPAVSVNISFKCFSCLELPRHFVIFNQDTSITNYVWCQKDNVQQLGQDQSQQYWLKVLEQSTPQSDIPRHTRKQQHKPNSKIFKQVSSERAPLLQHMELDQDEPHQQQPFSQPWSSSEHQVTHPPPAQLTTTNWQYQIMSKNSHAIISALADNSLTNSLANELRSRKLIGAAVYAKATSHGPDITEYWRANKLITAILSKIEHNPQRYHDFIEVLQLDGIREDAESALALLPTDTQMIHHFDETKNISMTKNIISEITLA